MIPLAANLCNEEFFNMTPTEEQLRQWQDLLEMFSDKQVLLHGAAGEDAMNVGDVLEIVRGFRTSIELHRQTQRILSETIASRDAWKVGAHAEQDRAIRCEEGRHSSPREPQNYEGKS